VGPRLEKVYSSRSVGNFDGILLGSWVFYMAFGHSGHWTMPEMILGEVAS
jgi:hypothetical protein